MAVSNRDDKPYRPRRLTGISPDDRAQEIDRDRDELAAVIEDLRRRVRQLESEPVMFAWAIAVTDGVGGVKAIDSYGCTVGISGSLVRLFFDQARPGTGYVAGGTPMGPHSRFAVVPVEFPFPVGQLNKTPDVVDFRLYDDTGSIVSASSTAFTAMYWASGPRV